MPRALVSVNDIATLVHNAYLTAMENGDAISLLFLGPPGVGKTSGVASAAVEIAARLGRRTIIDLSGDVKFYAEAAKEAGLELVSPRTPRELGEWLEKVETSPEEYFVYLRLIATHVTPEDLQYPRPVGSGIVNMPPVKLAMLTVPGVAGILFIDEITNVKREDAKTMFFALVNERSIGLAGDLSDGVVVTAAGNMPDESSAAEPLPAPLINRFAVFEVRPPTAAEFVEWYSRFCKGCSPAVPAFLMANPDYVYVKPSEPEGFENFPTPRTWFRAGQYIQRLPRNLRAAAAVALLGPEVGGKFAAWVELAPPQPQELAKKPEMLKNLKYETVLVAMFAFAQYAAKNKLAPETVAKVVEVAEEVIGEDVIVTMLRALAKMRYPLNLWAKLLRVLGKERILQLRSVISEIEEQLT